VDIGDPHQLRGTALLSVAEGDDAGPVRRIEAASVAVGHDAVADLDAGGRPGSDGARSTEINVIGVRRKTEHPPNPVYVRVERALCLLGKGSQRVSLFAS
jgi:hypothetical protein